MEYTAQSKLNLIKRLKTLPHDELLNFLDYMAEMHKESEKLHRKAVKDLAMVHELKKENSSLRKRLDDTGYNEIGNWIEKEFRNNPDMHTVTVARSDVMKINWEAIKND